MEGSESTEANGSDIFRGHEHSDLITSVHDIIAFDRRLWEVTKGLPIRTGSLLRVPSEAYPNWGIGLTGENSAQLAELADEFRRKDYREREENPHIEGMQKTDLSRSIRSSMARLIGHTVKEILRSLDNGKREFNICDLAASFGQTSSAIAGALWGDSRTSRIIERTSFHLVDYSAHKLYRARQELERYSPKSVDLHAKRDEQFLDGTAKRFDVVVSLCHFHKKPFLRELLAKIKGVLASKGVLVSADWHSSLSSHPSYIYELLERMGVESNRLKMFRDLMGDCMAPITRPDMTMDEMRAVADHQDHWIEVHQNILTSSRKMAREPRFYILGASEPTKATMRKMEAEGFIVDMDKIRKAFPTVPNFPRQLIGGSDRASVVLGKKGRMKAR